MYACDHLAGTTRTHNTHMHLHLKVLLFLLLHTTTTTTTHNQSCVYRGDLRSVLATNWFQRRERTGKRSFFPSRNLKGRKESNTQQRRKQTTSDGAHTSSSCFQMAFSPPAAANKQNTSGHCLCRCGICRHGGGGVFFRAHCCRCHCWVLLFFLFGRCMGKRTEEIYLSE